MRDEETYLFTRSLTSVSTTVIFTQRVFVRVLYRFVSSVISSNQIFIKLFLIAFPSFRSQRVTCVSLRKKSENNKPSMRHCDHMFLPINYLFFMSHDQIKCFKPCHTNKQTTHFSSHYAFSTVPIMAWFCRYGLFFFLLGTLQRPSFYKAVNIELLKLKPQWLTHLDLFQQIFVVHSARTWPPYRLSHPQTVTVVLALPSRRPCSQELDQVSAGVGPINPTTVFRIQTLCLSLLFHALKYLESTKHLKFPLSFFSSSSLWQYILWYNVITITSSYYI